MSGGTGNPYSLEERKQILQTIIDREAYHRVKSKTFWKEIEHEFDRHSWQSLRDHFRRQLFPNIHLSYYQLSAEEMQKFREGWVASLKTK